MTTQIKLQKPHVVRDAHPRTGAESVWLGLPPDTEAQEAKRQFQHRYGYTALAVRRYSGAVLVGPVVGQVKEEVTCRD